MTSLIRWGLALLCCATPSLAMAEPCAPVEDAAGLIAAANLGCSPITFDPAIAGQTITVAQQLLLKNGVVLDGEANNVTIEGAAGLGIPLVRINTSDVTVRNVTLRHPGKTILYISGSAANNNTVTATTLREGRYGVYVLGALHNRITRNSFVGNQQAGIYLKSGGNTQLSAPVIQTAQILVNETEWQIAGTGPAGGTVEVYTADPAPGLPAQGATFVAEAAIGPDGTFAITFPYPATDTTIPYTLIAIDASGNTSAFGDALVPAQANGFTALVDPDGDGVFNGADNCDAASNADQIDGDGDGLGDACDNCPGVVGAEQDDLDADGTGDICDADADGDGLKNLADNCPLASNPDQADVEADGVGNACDKADTDGDSVDDTADNCLFIQNADQANNDVDALGDACDEDLDGDTIANTKDNCPNASNVNQANADADATGDACELPDGHLDDDADLVANEADNCRSLYNPDQGDVDTDGLGDACDTDSDGDGVATWRDNCPLTANVDQTDSNGNGAGDACETPSENPPVDGPGPSAGDDSGGGCALVPADGGGVKAWWALLIAPVVLLGFARRRRASASAPWAFAS